MDLPSEKASGSDGFTGLFYRVAWDEPPPRQQSLCFQKQFTPHPALLVELEPGDVGNLVMLANVYAAAGRWDDVARTRKEIRSRCTRKTPGCSMIEVDNVLREFVAGDDPGPELGGLAAVLDIIASQLADDAESGS
ncbi:hypothetical protein ACP70R_034302 [Stipagrostis hirtigluma subsp. patula]